MIHPLLQQRAIRGFHNLVARAQILLDPARDVAFQLPQRSFAVGAQRLQPRRGGFGRRPQVGDFGAGGFQPFVVGLFIRS